MFGASGIDTRLWRGLVFASSVGGVLGATGLARAGNFDTFYLGNEAAMQAGAATASARRASAIWYNPAGLAQLDHSSIDASATAFSLTLGEDIDLDSTVPGSETTRLKSTPLSVVPAALSYARRLSWAGVGFALFVPTQESQFIRTRLRVPSVSQPLSYGLSVDASSVSQEYYAGPALAISLGERLRLGFALLAHYRTELTQTTLQFSATAGDISGNVLAHTTEDQQSVGVQPIAGVQFQANADWQLGFVLRAPTLRLYRQAQNIEQSLTTTPDGTPPEVDDEFSESSGFSSAILAPLRVHFGVARELGSGQIAAEVSYRAPLRDAELLVDQRGKVDARIGVQGPISDRVAVGSGIFSDRSADRLTEDANGRDIDYYGLSFGVQLDTPYGVISRQGEPFEAPRPLIFRTTLVLSYMLGLGQLQRLELGEGGADGPSIEVTNQDVLVHQVVLNVGATLLD